MTRHMLLFCLKPNVSSEAQERLFAKLRELPSCFPAMQDFELGRNMSERDQTFTYGMTMAFASNDELQAYLKSELHEGMVRQYFAPIVERRAIVSFPIC